MQYDAEKVTLGICKTGFEGCSERAVDLDFNLPDYCPDIQKVLKCQIYPKVTMRNIEGETLTVDGFYLVKLIYLDSEKMSIRCCEHTSPFSVQFNLKENMENGIVYTKTKVEYINCRALNQRRLEIHGAFSVCAKVKIKEEKSIVSGISGDGIEQKKISTVVNDLIATQQVQFSIEENIELDPDILPIELILRSDVSLIVNDIKTLNNKVIINATAKLDLFYVNDLESGNTEFVSFDIPISQIVDVIGVEEDSICDVILEEINHDLQLKLNEENGEQTLKVDMRFIFSGLIYNEKEIDYLEDAYSVSFETQKEKTNNEFLKIKEKVNLNFEDKNEIELNVLKINKVLDVWSEVIDVKGEKDDKDNIILKGKYNLCILILDENDEPVYIEKLIDFKYSYDPGNDIDLAFFEIEALITDINYKIKNDNILEVETEINFSGVIYINDNFESIVDLKIDEELPIEKDDDAVLKIYYAEKDETLWDIARKYSIPVEKIKLENEIEEDTLKTNTMLLIPM